MGIVLELARQYLQDRIAEVAPKAIVAEGLKRLESISEKLNGEHEMRLSFNSAHFGISKQASDLPVLFDACLHSLWPQHLRVEIQIRTALQHSWATAVEVASTFTGYDLESDDPKCEDERWIRFFAPMGSAIAI